MLVKRKNVMSELILVNSLPLKQNPAAVYLSNLSKSGRVTMEKSLSVIAGWITHQPDPFMVNWAALRFQDTNALRTKMLDDGMAPATVNKYLSAIRGTLKAAYDLELMSLDDYHRAKSVKSVKFDNLPAGRALTPGEVKALLDVCANDTTPAGARDASIIALLYAAGLRRSELISLDLDDYNPEDNSLVITGKGNKQRVIYVLNGNLVALRDWLQIRGLEPGPIYIPISRWGHLEHRPMSAMAIFKMLRKRAEQAVVNDFSPHDLRRSFISDMLNGGNDLSIVADLAGHEHVSTTARYDMRGEAAKRQAQDRLHVPYTGRKND
jgi:site-specific recombinase XerD